MTRVRLEHKTFTRRRCPSGVRLAISGAPTRQFARDSSSPLDTMLRHALIIGTSRHRWRPFSRLASPALDLHALHAVLTAPDIGGFEARAPLCDQPAFHLAMELESFFRDRVNDDLLLLYVAGHVVLDERGAPFLITHATERGRWRSSVIDFTFLRDVMAQSSSAQQVIVLDCALGSLGANGPALGARVDIGAALGGPGRTVLSASNGIRFRLDGDALSGDSSAAPWLRRIIDGLRTGEADLDGDGRISLEDLVGYAPGSPASSSHAPGSHASSSHASGSHASGSHASSNGAVLGAALAASRSGNDRRSVVIARRALAVRGPSGVTPPVPVELCPPAAPELRRTTPLRAGAPRSWGWASHAASSVASWLAEHVGR
jgi:hypothetical protein